MPDFFDIVVLAVLGMLAWKQRQLLGELAGRVRFICSDFRYEFHVPLHAYNERLLRRALRMIVADFQISSSGRRTLPTTAKVLVHPRDAVRLHLAEFRDKIQSDLAGELEQLAKQHDCILIAPPLIVVAEDGGVTPGFPLVDAAIERATSATVTMATVPMPAGDEPEADEGVDMIVGIDSSELRALTAGFPDLLLSMNESLVGGRSTRVSDLQVLEAKVSRQHFRVYPLDGRLWIEDLNSRNGTWLNGRKLNGPTALTNGDHLQVGRAEFELAETHLSAGTADPAAGT